MTHAALRSKDAGVGREVVQAVAGNSTVELEVVEKSIDRDLVCKTEGREATFVLGLYGLDIAAGDEVSSEVVNMHMDFGRGRYMAGEMLWAAVTNDQQHCKDLEG